MKYNFKNSTIGDACLLVTDGSHFSPKSVEHGEYMVSVKDFTPYGFDFDNCRQISANDYEKLKKSGCIPQYEDILIGKDGARYFEDIVVYRQTEQPALLSSIAILRCNTNELLPDYLYYMMINPAFKQNVRDNYGSGSAIPRIILKDFKRMPISYPSIKVQQRIISILRGIDAKIELNSKINANLQQQAQAIFKSWFVDFEPFGGVKPNSWIVSTLGEVTEMSAGGDKPKNISCTKSAEFPYPIYSNGLEKEGLYGYTDKAKIFAESVTVSARGTIGFVCLRHIPYVPIVRLITLLPKGELLSAKYLYLFLKQSHISGTGTTQQQLTVPNFRKAEILIPDKAVMDEFTKIVAPMYTEIWINEDENIRLSLLRDALLPKLMGGEIDISGI